jgi:hypothetical protein
VLTGEDAHYHEALTDGADGAILLSAHLETEAFASVCKLMKLGDRDGAQAGWEGVAELTRLLFAEPSPAPAKYWLARSGLIESAEVRLPMVEVSAELAAQLDAEFERRTPLLRRCMPDAIGPSRQAARGRTVSHQRAIGHDRVRSRAASPGANSRPATRTRCALEAEISNCELSIVSQLFRGAIYA